MTFAGIVGLLIFIYIRPPEFIPQLASSPIPFLYLFLGLIVLGIVIEVNGRKMRLLASPQLLVVLAFWFWCLVTIALRRPDQIVDKGIKISVSVTLYMVVAHGIQSVGRFIKATLTIFALGLLVACVMAHQGMQPFTCVEIIPNTNNTKGNITEILCPVVGPSGEPQDGQAKCIEAGQEGLAYVCEKPGYFGTFSIQGRVRYLGVLQDPNEVSLATSMAVPFAFSFFEQKRSFTRLLLLLATLAVVAVGVFFSLSRGGQLVFATVLGAYFVKKYGYKIGVAIAAVMAGPLMLLGGRSGEEANQSAMERLEAAAAGIQMMIRYPLTGVGYGQYTEYHNLTAHNAYILSAGELGFGGMCLFVTLLVISLKIPVAVLQHSFAVEDSDVPKVKSLAMAMLAAFVGVCVGIFFLSWTDHYVLWIHLGLSGALYSVARAKDPTFDVKLTRRDIGIAVAFCVVVLVALTIQTKRKGAW